jgi:uncharacterized protein YeaO (DUF488 family)
VSGRPGGASSSAAIADGVGQEGAALSVSLKRAYETPGPDDGLRVLVDRLWPRGVSRAAAGIDVWLKEVAPSDALRTWFGHDPARWDEFRRRYREELDASPAAVAELRERAALGPITLVYSARDEAHNNAVVLREYIEEERA